MRFIEYGDIANEKIILIHGANIPWQMWLPCIEHFKKIYRVIVPVLDGHDGDIANEFISVNQSAKDIVDFYTTNYNEHVNMIIGMSMGAAIAFDIVADGRIKVDKLIFDSGVFVKSNPIISAIHENMQVNMNNKAKKRDNKIMVQLENIYGKELLPYFLQMADSMSKLSLVKTLRSVCKYQIPEKLSLDNIQIVAFHGTVLFEINAKKSAKYLTSHYPKARVKIFDGYNHGGLSVNRSNEFIEEIENAF